MAGEQEVMLFLHGIDAAIAALIDSSPEHLFNLGKMIDRLALLDAHQRRQLEKSVYARLLVLGALLKFTGKNVYLLRGRQGIGIYPKLGQGDVVGGIGGVRIWEHLEAPGV